MAASASVGSPASPLSSRWRRTHEAVPAPLDAPKRPLRTPILQHVFAALAEFERDLIRERTHAGLTAPRARGRTGGRSPRLSPDQVRTARRLYEQQDITMTQFDDVLGVSRTTVYRALHRESEPLAGRRRK